MYLFIYLLQMIAPNLHTHIKNICRQPHESSGSIYGANTKHLQTVRQTATSCKSPGFIFHAGRLRRDVSRQVPRSAERRLREIQPAFN